MNEGLRERIWESLDNAIENGYYLYDQWASDLAEETIEYDSQFEEMDPKELVPHVRAWLDKQYEGTVPTIEEWLDKGGVRN